MPAGPNYHTLLEISGAGVPPYAARGLKQSLRPVASTLKRTVNGNLIDLTAEQFRKYASTISATDMDPPAFGNLWPGMELTVDCIGELAYPVGGTPERVVVPGSQRTENGFVFYRPRITFLVAGFQMNKDEYGAITEWSLELQEG